MQRNITSVGQFVKLCLFSLLIIGISTATAQVGGLRLVRGPHILQVTPNSAVIAWMTDLPGTTAVNYGTTLSLGSSASDGSNATAMWHTLTLNGLSPNTTYFYRVVSNGVPLNLAATDFKITTSPSPANPGFTNFKFVVLGDSGFGCSSPNSVQCELADKINTVDPNLMLHTGDINYLQRSLTDDGYTEAYFSPYQRIIRRIPMFPSPGNHEWDELAGSLAKPYLDNFNLPRNRRYYSFDYGNAHFVSLDTQLLNDPDLDPLLGYRQFGWLEEDLANSTAVWKFIYFHFPPFSSGDIVHGSDLNVRQYVSSFAQRYNVDVVFSGHDHIYERSKPVMVDESNPQQVGVIGNGVVYIVTGGGGSALYTHDWPDSCSTQGGCTSDIPSAQCGCTATFRTINESFWHFVRADINNLSLQLRTVKSNLATGTDDTYTITKGILQGRVTATGGIPVSNATVTTYVGSPTTFRQRALTQTSSNGTFQLYLMAGQTYQMLVTAPCFATPSLFTVSIPPNGGTITQNVTLSPQSGACVPPSNLP